MADQGDLQKWLEELRRRAGSPQGGGGQGRRYQPAPPPREQSSTVRPDAPKPLSMEEYLARATAEEKAREVDITRAISLKEQRRRKREALQHRQERQRKREQLEAERVDQQRRQQIEAGREAVKRRTAAHARLKQEADAQGKPAGKRGRATKGIRLEKLHRYLRGNRAVLREAVILSEILGRPKALRESEGLWEQ